MSFQVIRTGFGRTGTHSLKLALEQLGFGKCYHMEDLLEQPDDIVYFEKADRGERVDWELLKEYHSACDFPIILYIEALMKQYPDARYIHTSRDPDAWYKSFNDTIMKVSKPSLFQIIKTLLRMPFSAMVRKRLKVLQFNGRMLDKMFGKGIKTREGMIKHFKEHNEKMLRLIPPEKLLVYEVKNGWEPLCRFLGVPVPTMPFPVSNTTDEFVSRAKKM